MNLSWNFTRGSNLLISTFLRGDWELLITKSEVLQYFSPNLRWQLVESHVFLEGSFVLDVLADWKSKAEQNIWFLFFFWSLPTRMSERCKTCPVCVKLGSRDKERHSTRLQVEMLERNECIRSFHTQRIDLYFCDKEPNHRNVWSLSFLSSCLSLLEHTHTKCCHC